MGDSAPCGFTPLKPGLDTLLRRDEADRRLFRSQPQQSEAGAEYSCFSGVSLYVMAMIKRLAPGFILLVAMDPGFAQSPQPLLLPDAGISSVSPSDIFFDTFDGRYIPLSKIRSEEIVRLRDRIRPIYSPKFVDKSEMDWLYPNDRVIIYRGETMALRLSLKDSGFP